MYWTIGDVYGVMVIVVGSRLSCTRLLAFHIVLIPLGKVRTILSAAMDK